ncbi:hypothetical protein J6590_066013 [Homalodisca vitripennis]|nr:hypothetical protein J6590_066013 [Homalodisca vitripennis]
MSRHIRRTSSFRTPLIGNVEVNESARKRSIIIGHINPVKPSVQAVREPVHQRLGGSPSVLTALLLPLSA